MVTVYGAAMITLRLYDRRTRGAIEDVRRKADLDLEYIRNRSPLHDLEIMVRTLPVVVMKRGAI